MYNNNISQINLSDFKNDRIQENNADDQQPIIKRKSCTSAVFEYHYTACSALHCHDCYELEIVTSGSGIQILNGEELQVKVGTIMLLSPADIHMIKSTADERLIVANIKFIAEDLAKELWNILNTSQMPICYTGSAKHYSKIIGMIDTVLDRTETLRAPLDKLIITSILESIICLVLGSQEESSALPEKLPADKASESEAMITAFSYIRRFFRHRISAVDVAKFCHYSPNYFGAVFKEFYNISFNNYLNQLRLEYALRLLKNTELTIAEISSLAGFESVSYFTRLFHRRYDNTPGKIRIE